MSLFESVWSKVKETINKHNIERRLKASYKTILCKKEETLIDKENQISKILLEENATFIEVYDLFLEIKEIKGEIEIIKEAYEYIFNKETKIS